MPRAVPREPVPIARACSGAVRVGFVREQPGGAISEERHRLARENGGCAGEVTPRGGVRRTLESLTRVVHGEEELSAAAGGDADNREAAKVLVRPFYHQPTAPDRRRGEVADISVDDLHRTLERVDDRKERRRVGM